MSKFKSGDRVSPLLPWPEWLTLGRTYTVTKTRYGVVYVIGDSGREGQFLEDRFALAGDDVECACAKCKEKYG